MLLLQNEYFIITEKDKKLFIQVFMPGFSIRDFQIVIEKYPHIMITKFMALRAALESPTAEEIEFGVPKSKIELKVSPDNLEARIIINLDQETFEKTKEALKEEIFQLLREKLIIHGILYDVINKELRTKSEIIIAKGSLPEEGKDASVTYLELPETKPEINNDDSTNYYEMNLFKYIHKGDWVGEKIFLITGESGMNIKGEVLPGKAGKDKALRYDPKSIEAIEEENKTLLRARFDGALQVKGGKISVMKHLMIKGNIGYETGNINFDGYVTINGTVEDGFSVVAQDDISILGEMGMGAVERIHSKSGSVYIKGGISGKSRSVVEAGKSVFAKYVNAATIIAKDSIDIGYYALDSSLQADTILVQAKNARTIGGTIKAKTKVSLRMVGNIYEKETYIHVEGFDRRAIKKELDALLIAYKELLIKAEKNERELRIYENTLVQFGRMKSDEDYMGYQRIYQTLVDKLYVLEEHRQDLLRILASRGEGQVTIYEKAYPKTFLQIKNLQKRIKEMTTGTFYAQDNQLIFD